MEHQHMTTILKAYKRGSEKRYKDKNNAPELKMHYFKVISYLEKWDLENTRHFYKTVLDL